MDGGRHYIGASGCCYRLVVLHMEALKEERKTPSITVSMGIELTKKEYEKVKEGIEK